jgi:hypothetical protein
METRSSGVRCLCLGDGLKAPRCLGTHSLGLGGKRVLQALYSLLSLSLYVLCSHLTHHGRLCEVVSLERGANVQIIIVESFERG